MTHDRRSTDEAERSVIGAMVLSNDTIDDVRTVCQTECFSVYANRLVAEAVFALHDRRVSVDLVTLRDELESMGKLRTVGGVEFLVQVVEACPSATNAPFYASIVQDGHLRRSVAEAAQKVLNMSSTPMSGAEYAAEAARILASAAQGAPAGGPTTVLDLARIDMADSEKGVPSPWPSLNRVTSCGGFPCGQVTIVRAETGVGKTPFMTQSAYNTWKSGGRVAYALFADLTPAQFKQRVAKLVTGRTSPPPPHQRDAFGDGQSDADIWSEAMAEINDSYSDGRFTVWNGSTGQARNIETFKSWATSEHRRDPFSLVCIDYLQTARTHTTRPMSAYERVTQVGSVITDLAFGLQECATIVGSQVTQRDGKTVARYATEAENDAALMVEVCREKGVEACTIKVVKNRFGIVGAIEGFMFDMRHLSYVDPRRNNGVGLG